MDRLPDHDPLSEAPLLRAIPKEDPFVVPDGFFDRFPHDVQAAIARRARTRWSLPLRLGLTIRGSRLAWTAASVLALALGAFWLRESSQGPVPTALATTESPTAIPAVESLQWSDDDLYALLEGEPDAWPALAGAGFTADELEAYLLSTDEPIDFLNEDL